MPLTKNEVAQLALLIVDEHLNPDRLEYLTVSELAPEFASEGFTVFDEDQDDFVESSPEVTDDDIKEIYNEAVNILEYLRDRTDGYYD